MISFKSSQVLASWAAISVSSGLFLSTIFKINYSWFFLNSLFWIFLSRFWSDNFVGSFNLSFNSTESFTAYQYLVLISFINSAFLLVSIGCPLTSLRTFSASSYYFTSHSLSFIFSCLSSSSIPESEESKLSIFTLIFLSLFSNLSINLFFSDWNSFSSRLLYFYNSLYYSFYSISQFCLFSYFFLLSLYYFKPWALNLYKMNSKLRPNTPYISLK